MTVSQQMTAAMVMLAAALALIAYLGRYEINAVASGGEAGVFVLDRWTGTVWACDRNQRCNRAYPPQVSD